MSRPRFPLFLLLAGASLHAQTPTATDPIEDQAIAVDDGQVTIDLSDHFDFPGTTGKIAIFETVLGDFAVELLDEEAPKHVTNFTAYANDPDLGDNYDGTFIHRASSLELDSSNLPDLEEDPKILQGGGFAYIEGRNYQISPRTAVELEYEVPNERGTLAAARGSSANSATSGWFFNVADNSETLGQVNGAGGYSVFGRVLGDGMDVLDAMAEVKRFRYSASFNEMPLRDYTSGEVDVEENFLLIHRIRVGGVYPTGSLPGALRFEVETSDDEILFAKILGSTLYLEPLAAGTSTVTVRALDADGNDVTAEFEVEVEATGPRILAQPEGLTVAPGGEATFEVDAAGAGALSYQWAKNGEAIAGATAESLTLSNVDADDAGSFAVTVTDANGSTVSRAATLTVATPQPGALISMSALNAARPLIAGLVTRDGEKSVLVRALGPTLETAFDFTEHVQDPWVTVHSMVDDEREVVASNNNWGGGSSLRSVFSQVGAVPLRSSTSRDAATVVEVEAGPTTAVVTTTPAAAEGFAMVEAFDVEPDEGGRWVNVSARGQVGLDDEQLVLGFAIDGNVPRRVLIRAVGPTLGSQFEIRHSLVDPTLALHASTGGQDVLIATNDDWHLAPEVVATTPIGFALEDGSTDAAIVATLSPGNYTVTVGSLEDTEGVALVEVYLLP